MILPVCLLQSPSSDFTTVEPIDSVREALNTTPLWYLVFISSSPTIREKVSIRISAPASSLHPQGPIKVCPFMFDSFQTWQAGRLLPGNGHVSAGCGDFVGDVFFLSFTYAGTQIAYLDSFAASNAIGATGNGLLSCPASVIGFDRTLRYCKMRSYNLEQNQQMQYIYPSCSSYRPRTNATSPHRRRFPTSRYS